MFSAIFTGMRHGELVGLQWGDIDWVNQKIHAKRSLYKGGYQTLKSEYSKRAIDMGPRLIQVLKEHRGKQKEIRLYPRLQEYSIFFNKTYANSVYKPLLVVGLRRLALLHTLVYLDK